MLLDRLPALGAILGVGVVLASKAARAVLLGYPSLPGQMHSSGGAARAGGGRPAGRTDAREIM
jgi:hypothetical protein